jgi:hypothetical protein
MFDRGPRESTVLNWRGPLLATAIFAMVFAILLLMAHQNQSNASDMGSSLREDPFGTSLLFDSYGHAGYQVKRSQDEDTLSDQDASQTTAFFIGGYPYGDWEMGSKKPNGAGKFRARVEDFLGRGGRVVLIEHAQGLESKTQGWKVELAWNQTVHQASPTWIPPDLRAMPEGSEPMYLMADAPWLKTDEHWTALYKGAAEAVAKGKTATPSKHALRC